jgi:hypothetical protein
VGLDFAALAGKQPPQATASRRFPRIRVYFFAVVAFMRVAVIGVSPAAHDGSQCADKLGISLPALFVDQWLCHGSTIVLNDFKSGCRSRGVSADHVEGNDHPFSYLQAGLSIDRRADAGWPSAVIGGIASALVAKAWEQPSSDGSGEELPKLWPTAIARPVKLHELFVQPRLSTRFLVAHRTSLDNERIHSLTARYLSHRVIFCIRLRRFITCDKALRRSARQATVNDDFESHGYVSFRPRGSSN